MKSVYDSTRRKLADWITWTWSLLPALVIVAFYGCVLHARLVLGGWPSLSQPDPKAIESGLFEIHRGVILAGAVLTSVSPTIWLLAVPSAEHLMSLKSFFVRLTIYLFSLAAFLAFVRMDPGNFIAWFVD